MDGTVPSAEVPSAGSALTGPQARVDAEESEAERRYQRWRELGDLIADALRRAEALTRLEHQLATHSR